MAVTLALAFATTRMVKENNLVRVLRACETMGNATVICSDKTGTLTQNKMTVVAGTLGTDDRFGQLTDREDRLSSNISEKFWEISASVQDLVLKGIALNSTAFEGEENGERVFIGSKTEVALLQLAQSRLGLNLAEERANSEVTQLIPFDSTRKCMGVVIRLPLGGYRLHVKGAAESMLAKATHVISDLPQDPFSLQPLSESSISLVLDTINSYSSRSLRTIGMVYKDFESWPPDGAALLEDDQTAASFDDIFHNMTWVGVFGIQDPLRPEVPAAIQRCSKAGVAVKMVTGLPNPTLIRSFVSLVGKGYTFYSSL